MKSFFFNPSALYFASLQPTLHLNVAWLQKEHNHRGSILEFTLFSFLTFYIGHTPPQVPNIGTAIVSQLYEKLPLKIAHFLGALVKMIFNFPHFFETLCNSL